MKIEIGKTDHKFGVLGKRNDPHPRLILVCRCGKVGLVKEKNILSGLVKDCGCGGKHIDGRASHPLYPTWASMRHRCQNPADISYRNYGARGIKVCDRWNLSFWLFAKDVGDRPEGLTLDRINGNGDYEPGNVRWATWEEQAANRRKC